MEITEQERQSLIEMTIGLSEFLNQHEFDDVIRVYKSLIERLKLDGIQKTQRMEIR
jgi:hypothetical protein